MSETKTPFKAGYCAIIGRPNVGKSTILNQIIEYKLSIVSPKPETTRHNILGIFNSAHAQVVFIDTPGIHVAKSYLSKYMVSAAHEAILEADLVVMVIDARDGITDEDRMVAESITSRKTPCIVAINKADLVKKSRCLPIIEVVTSEFPFVRETIPISALSKDDAVFLREKIVSYLPAHLPYFPPDEISDRPERFFVAEFIREKALLLTYSEVPYAVAVAIEEFEEKPNLVRIAAVLYVERDTQKKILIGAKGEMLKKIGTLARADIETLLGKKVYLALWVKVLDHWRKDPRALSLLGYTHGSSS